MKTIVIKIGGSVASNITKRKALLKKLIALSKKQAVVLVHGGKEQINRFLDLFNIKTKFVNGHRYTDEKSLEIVAAALNKVNHELVAEINLLGGCAVGFSGIDGKMIKARRIKSLGFVGKIVHIDTTLIKTVLSECFIPVVSPVCSTVTNHGGVSMLNVNADSAASDIAVALKADKLIFVSDVPGILGRNKKVLPVIRTSHIDSLKKDKTVSGGMLPKIDGCGDAILKGVRKIVITDRLDRPGTKIVK